MIFSKFKPIFASFMLSLFLGGCASLVDKGNKLYESGLYSEAESFYKRALIKDPDNTEARIGLEKSRVKIIDRGLIDVRMMRLGSDMQNAATTLEQLLRNQEEWSISPKGAIAMTQKEEVGAAKFWLIAKSQEFANSEYPDKLRFMEYSLPRLISASSIEDQLIVDRATAKEKGVRKCRSMAEKVKEQRFFLASLTKKYCGYWGSAPQLNYEKIDTTRFSSLNLIRKEVRLFPQHHRRQISAVRSKLSTLPTEFEDNVWFSRDSQRPLLVKAKLTTQYIHQIDTERRTKSYHTKETYTSKNDEGKDVSKTKKVKHRHRYLVKLHNEEYRVDAALLAQIKRSDVVANINRIERNRSEEHNEEFPDANLYPEPPELMDTDSLLYQQLDGVKRQFFNKLTARWETLYCRQANNEMLEDEKMLRCAAVAPQNEAVNSWAVKHYGVNYDQLVKLYP